MFNDHNVRGDVQMEVCRNAVLLLIVRMVA